MEVDAQLLSDRPCLSQETYNIGMASGTLEGSPDLYDSGQWNGQNSHGLGRHSLMCGSRGSCREGVPQDFEERNLKIQSRLRFGT